MVDTDDTRRTTDAGRRTTPRVWHKLPTGELKIILRFKRGFFNLLSASFETWWLIWDMAQNNKYKNNTVKNFSFLNVSSKGQKRMLNEVLI